MIYGFLLLMPLLGWLLLSAEGKQISLLGLQLPALISADPASAEFFEFCHESLASAGYLLIGLHILAALYHQHLVHDNRVDRPRRERQRGEIALDQIDGDTPVGQLGAGLFAFCRGWQ